MALDTAKKGNKNFKSPASCSGRASALAIVLTASMVTEAMFVAPAYAQQAQSTVTAESLFLAGQDAMKAGDFKKACDNFGASQKADPSVGTLLNLALCNEKQGNTATAWATYKEASSLAKQKGDAERDQVATEHANGLQAKLSKLTITSKSTPPGLVVSRDGVDIGVASLGAALPIDPGEHAITAVAPGFKKATISVKIGPVSDNQTIELPALEAAPLDEAPGTPGSGGGGNGLLIGGAVIGGLGVVGLIVGAGTGGAAASGKSKVDTLCPNKTCNTQTGKDKLSSTKTLATVSTIGLIGGGVLLAGGAVMVIVAATSKKKSHGDDKPTAGLQFTPSFGPTGGGGMLSGSF